MRPIHRFAKVLAGLARWCFLALALSSLGTAHAANKTCTGGNMSVGASWGGTVPVATDTLRINGACIVDNAFANLAYGTLEVSRGAAGTVSWPVSGTATLNVTTVLTGGFGAGTINMTNGGTLQIRTGWTSTNTTLTPGTGTVNWNVTGAASTLPTLPAVGVNTYNNLTITATGRIASLGLATTVNGNLLISAGTLSVSASNFALNVKGNFTNNAAFTQATGTVTMSGTTAQAIDGSATTTFSGLTITNISAAVSLSPTTNLVNVSGTLNMNGFATLLTPLAAVVINNAAAAGTITGSGTVQVTRTAATADYSSQYKFVTNTLTNLTVEYIGTATQVVSALSYGNLKISNISAAVTAAANFNVSGTLNMNGAATLLTPAAAVVINNAAAAGTITGSGTVQVTRTAATADYSSQYKFVTNTLTNLTVEYSGAAAQTVSALTYGGLKIDNASGATLAGATTVGGTLTFTSGNITTGANTLITVPSCASPSVVRTSGHVVGDLQKALPAGAPPCIFEVGSGANYTPLTLTFFTLPTPGNLTVSATSGEHPDTTAGTSSLVRSAQGVNRYWTLKNSTLAGIFSAAATYVATDLDALATYPNFSVSRGTTCSGTRTCASWAIQSLGAPAPSAILITATAMSMTSGAAETDLVVGEPTLPRVRRAKEFIFTRELY
ncbi:MAG: hypothetical protein AABM33_03810 [Pseudomonadota bacterium]